MFIFLTLLKSYASKTLELGLKYPSYVIILILSFTTYHYYSSHNEDLEKIANLTTANLVLKKSIEKANKAIKEQNESILRYKESVADLDNKLKEANSKKIGIDNKVDKWQKHDAPVLDSEAFKWLNTKAGELKLWAK